MALNYDITLNNNDLYFQNGDMVISQSDNQHIQDNLYAFPGWWKQYPLDGVGLYSYLNGSGIEQELQRRIDLELAQDGYQTFGSVVYFDSAGVLQINPNVLKS